MLWNRTFFLRNQYMEGNIIHDLTNTKYLWGLEVSLGTKAIGTKSISCKRFFHWKREISYLSNESFLIGKIIVLNPLSTIYHPANTVISCNIIPFSPCMEFL